MEDLRELCLSQVLQGLRSRDFSAVELTECYLRAIAKAVKLNCYVKLCPDRALESARQSDSLIAKNDFRSLEGVCLAVKDVFCTKDIETTACSEILRGFKPPYESTVTSNLWTSGAFLLGKTNNDEFAMGSSNEFSCFGSVVNPHRSRSDDRLLVAGGSSGGSAGAVAARLCLAAIGTDTGGSIRQPASFSGIVGMKPTYGLCSRYGILAFASSLDQAGPFTRNVTDCAIMLSQMVSSDCKDSTSINFTKKNYADNLNNDIRNLRIGIPKEYSTDDMADEIRTMWQESADMLRQRGAQIVDICLPHTKYALPTYYVLALAEASSNMARYDGIRYGSNISERKDIESLYNQNRSQFGEEVKRRIFIGTYVLSARYYDAYYLKAQKVRRLISNDFDEAMTKVDVILTPTTNNAAFALGDKLDDSIAMYLNDVFTVPANMAGLPALSLPMGRDSAELPLGMQIIGRPLGEQHVLNVAYALEGERGDFALPSPWWEDNSRS